MKIIIFLTLVAFAAEIKSKEEKPWTSQGYLRKVSTNLPNKISFFEKASLMNRIIGGEPSKVLPYQAGIIITHKESDPTAICGGSLISDKRVVTAGHCWTDGNKQATRATVVLGSTYLYHGGTRIESEHVVVHPEWSTSLINDVAVVFLPNPVIFSSTVAPIALPTGPEFHEDFAGEKAIASGFGFTDGGPSGEIMTQNQYLSAVELVIITNKECHEYYPWHVRDRNICTSGLEGGVCGGDSGGPLAVYRNNIPVLVGIASFVSQAGCSSLRPSVYARVTSFMNFINQHL